MNRIKHAFCGIVMLLPFLASAQAAKDEGLILSYPFNGSANDESGNMAHAKIFGAVPAIDRFGIASGCFYFDETDKMKLPCTPIKVQELSINFWYKTTDDEFTLISASNPTFSKEFFIGLSKNNEYQLQVAFHDSNDENIVVYPAIPLDDQWHMLTVVAAEDFTRIYIDGAEEDAEDIGLEGGLDLQSLWFGAQQKCMNGCWKENSQYKGFLDDVKIYKRQLGKEEIARMFKFRIDKLPPAITISSPYVSRGVKMTPPKVSQITITGQATDESGTKSIFVNDMPVSFSPDGSFSTSMIMNRSSFTVTAIDSLGNKVTETFSIGDPAEAVAAAPAPTPAATGLTTNGKYYAIIIGIQDYLDNAINDLDQPANDAQRLYTILTGKYSFEAQNTILLKNPKREEITKQFDLLTDKLTDQDNLLIFYAGHGYWDEKLRQGYWLPADASQGNRGTWFSNSDLKTYIGGISSKHTLLIADACFGGSIFKTRDAFTNSSPAINELYKMPSRKAMTSGALKTVPDKSVFIEYLCKRLADNSEKYLSTEQLYSSFKTAVINNSPNGQIPQFGDIRETGDEGGDFIFILK